LGFVNTLSSILQFSAQAQARRLAEPKHAKLVFQFLKEIRDDMKEG